MTDRYIEKLENQLDEARQRIATLEAELATARNTIVNLLGENRALRAELRRKEPPPSFNKELDGEEI